MKTVTPCPKCNRILEPVENINGDILGYFCLNVLSKACDYIDVMSSTEYQYKNSDLYTFACDELGEEIIK
jgi:hypothetical protein|tara:strand:+ start:433 stop:642 length:210 start_codon:yes stop_codon:yes gene_type:complete